jgi:hypothetical protein
MIQLSSHIILFVHDDDDDDDGNRGADRNISYTVVVGHDMSAVAFDVAAVSDFMLLSSLGFVPTATAVLLVPPPNKIFSNIFGYIDDGIVLVLALWIADGYFCKSVEWT